jgi:hypothetical protein
MSLHNARLPSLRDKLETKALAREVSDVVEDVLDGKEPKKSKLKAKILKDNYE